VQALATGHLDDTSRIHSFKALVKAISIVIAVPLETSSQSHRRPGSRMDCSSAAGQMPSSRYQLCVISALHLNHSS
jgi:hypothetical protein